jgi:ribosome maturation factor RimP
VTFEEEIPGKVSRLLEPILEEHSLDLVDVQFRPSGRRWSLKVFIDKSGGVTIGDCGLVSRELSRILDVEDFIEKSYVLEVSSPGLTRALKTRADFERYRGRECRIVTSVPVDGKNDFAGVIGSVTEDIVEIGGKAGTYAIPLHAIRRANLELTL